MSDKSYEFDPCSIDESNNEEVTLDNWKPTENKKSIVMSKWRQEQIGHHFNQHPGIDELNKIHGFLKKKAPDSEIMQAFGITAETLVAIKKGKYDPVDGISLDNQSKIYKEFQRLEDRIESLFRGLHYIADSLKFSQPEFKKKLKKPKKEKMAKVKIEKDDKNEICEESEEICEESDNFNDGEE